jgi:hypothetical protein
LAESGGEVKREGGLKGKRGVIRGRRLGDWRNFCLKGLKSWKKHILLLSRLKLILK